MRDCRVCGTPNAVLTKTGPATCPTCRREKYLVVKRRYQQSEKGKATARAREERADVREKRRRFSASPQGQTNKAKYAATPKGKATRQQVIARRKESGKASAIAAAQHQRRKDDPPYRERRTRTNQRYRKTAKGKALAYRQYAKRKKAVLLTENPLTADEWAEILREHDHHCRYCGKKAKLTIDHVIPLTKGGEHSQDNVVPACQSCNSKKRDKLDWLIVPAAPNARRTTD